MTRAWRARSLPLSHHGPADANAVKLSGCGAAEALAFRQILDRERMPEILE